MASANPVSECPVCQAEMAEGARYCGGCGAAIVNTKSSEHQAQSSPDVAGREIAGRYRILAKLGEGGMGAVYRAEQMSLKRRVALKLLKPELSAEPGLVRRFNAEAELAAKLNHPNTVTLYDFGQDESGALFIAMEFISGRSLRQEVVRGGPLGLQRIVDIGSQICGSLSDAHATGIVHRDLKPDNVMLSERGRKTDFVTVLDFGIAKLRDEKGDITQQPMTRAGDILGTPQYMAPEQIRGEKVDARTDIYALGVMLYEMVTARLPFDGNTIMALLSKHLTEAPVAPDQKRPDLRISPALSQLVMQCLAKDPAHRPATMELVERALVACADRAEPVLGTGRQAAPSVPAMQHAPTGYAPTGYAPTGYAPTALPPASIHSVAPHGAPPQGVPHPQTTAVLPGKQPKTLLWGVLLLILLGAGGAGAYLVFFAGASSDAAASDESFNMAAWEGSSAAVPPEPLDLPVSDDAESDNAESDDAMAKLHDDTAELQQAAEMLRGVEDLEELEEDLEVRRQLAKASDDVPTDTDTQLYEDSAFPYSMTVPAGFIGGGDGLGNATFTGLVDGNQVIIIGSAWSEPGEFTEEQIELALQIRLSTLQLETTSGGWRGQGKRRHLRGTLLSLADQQKGDFLLKRRGPVFFFAAIGGPPVAYRNTKAFRQAFLNGGFRTR